VQAWPQGWLSYGGLLVGEQGAGKTHLLTLWRRRTDAADLASALQAGLSPTEATAERKHWLLDGLEPWLGSRKAEEPLFHWLNAINQVGGSILMSSRLGLDQIRTLLPDVRSRLMQFPSLPITQPDDKLLRGLLRKQAADRQWVLAPEVEEYLLPRVERSYTAVQALMASIDAASLAKARPVTVPLVREVLGENITQLQAA
jgi:chromosomal replication initiation ATPase DnaA